MRLAAAVLVAACFAGGNAWMPLDVGHKWIYAKSRKGKAKGEEVVEVMWLKGEKEAARHVLTGRYFMEDGSFFETQAWADDKGLWMRRTEKDAPEDEAILLLKSPVEKGTWEVKVKNLEHKDCVFAFENLGEEPVKVPAGEFTAVKVRCTFEKGLYSDYWFARDVGLVRRQHMEGSHEEMLLELKSFAKGEAPKK